MEKHDWPQKHRVRCWYGGGSPTWSRPSESTTWPWMWRLCSLVGTARIASAKEGGEPVLANCTRVEGWLGPDQVAKVHRQSGHPGVNRTLYFARIVDPHVSKKDVRSIVKACETCRSIDPAPVRWKKEKLSVESNWIRLVMDIVASIFWRSSIAVHLDLQCGDCCAGKMRPPSSFS